MSKDHQICEVEFDHAYYLGDENDGVYFTAEKEGGLWYMSAVVDCNSSGFTDGLVTDDGPYASYEEACEAGVNAALEWCSINEVAVDDSEIDGTRDAIHLDGTMVE